MTWEPLTPQALTEVTADDVQAVAKHVSIVLADSAKRGAVIDANNAARAAVMAAGLTHNQAMVAMIALLLFCGSDDAVPSELIASAALTIAKMLAEYEKTEGAKAYD